MWPPWMSAAEARELAEEVIARPREWKADDLAAELGVTMALRDALHLRTIGAIDCNARQRKRLRRKRDAAAKAAKRLAAGARPHAESTERTRPWEAEGISRVTYYRRRKAAREANDTNSAQQGPKVAAPKQYHLGSEPCRAAEGWPSQEMISITEGYRQGGAFQVEVTRSW